MHDDLTQPINATGERTTVMVHPEYQPPAQLPPAAPSRGRSWARGILITVIAAMLVAIGALLGAYSIAGSTY